MNESCGHTEAVKYPDVPQLKSLIPSMRPTSSMQPSTASVSLINNGENEPGNAMTIFLTGHHQELRIWSIRHTKGTSER
jgi:hypothetical protein